jgi:hypothetical protein
MNGEDSEIRVQLARMEGKQDVTNERLSNVQNDIVEIRLVQRGHGDRLGVLEAKENMRSGERRGLSAAGRFVWAGIGSIIGGGGITVAMKLLGS